MVAWKRNAKFGVAIWNYQPEGKVSSNKLNLLIGEPVHIDQEHDDWFYGYSLVTFASGIFPKNFIVVQDYEKELKNKQGSCHYRFTFQQEIIFILREWNKHLKTVYTRGSLKKFHTTKELIFELIASYQRFTSGILTSDEMRTLRSEIIEKIDIGNKLLDLDLIVRCRDGSRINPGDISAIEYFELHDQIDRRTQKALKRSSIENEITYLNKIKRISSFRYSNNCEACTTGPSHEVITNRAINYQVCVSLVNFVCTIRQDMDILISLYDAKECHFLNESYIVKWDKQGLVRDIDKLNNIRILFTDITQYDMNEKKLFLIFQVIRIGTMNLDLPKNYYKKNILSGAKKTYDELKRPCGVATFELQNILNNSEYENKEIFIPFIQYTEKDSLDQMIRKATREVKDTSKDLFTQGFHITVKMLSTNKTQIVDQHSAFPGYYILRKIGFPDIILPEDVRNDLYLTLVSGEFYKGSKKSERNIEVTVKVLDGDGNVINDCFRVDSDNGSQSFYKSVVYYHEDKPKWMENIKISLSIESFCNSHLKFTFKHRSSNENKDKNEKAFALAFMPLMSENGITLKDSVYDLLVYKFDSKKFNESDISYLSLAPTKSEFKNKFDIDPTNQLEMKRIVSKKSSSLVVSAKDMFTISIVVCSTKLAQNNNIFGLLNWKEQRDKLKQVLYNVQKLDGGDVIKFLHDSLDALFEIWMDTSVTDTDQFVFDALIYIIRLLMKEKYAHFQKILDDYIEKHFSATLVFNKMVDAFKFYIENPEHVFCYDTVTCMQYIFKFVVRSRSLFVLINGNDDPHFGTSLDQLFQLFIALMSDPNENLLKIKSGLLKYFPRTVPNLMTVFSGHKLSKVFVEMIVALPVNQLISQKLSCIHDIIYTELFKNYPECRKEMFPVITTLLQDNLTPSSQDNLEDDRVNAKMHNCLLILKDILHILKQNESHCIRSDIFYLMITLLDTLLLAFAYLEHKLCYLQHLWSIVITLLNELTEYHFKEFFRRSQNFEEMKSFLVRLLAIFKRVTTKSIYPDDWYEMNIAQNMVILKTIENIVECVRKQVDFHDDHIHLWKELLFTEISFIIQKPLQLESLTKQKRERIEFFHNDMRLKMSDIIRKIWHAAGDKKNSFVPSIIGGLLEVALIPNHSIRQNTINIFFDMIYSCFTQVDTIRNEFITQLDHLITSGKGDIEFKECFKTTFTKNGEHHSVAFKEECFRFVSQIVQQSEMLLLYRDVVKHDDNHESIMSSIIELLDFYDQIDRRELYIRYLDRLYSLHLKCENYTEAAYTLSRYAHLLEWNDASVESYICNSKYGAVHTHRQLKEKLFYEIIDNFSKAQLWEAGLSYCKSLVEQYEHVLFDYAKLSSLLTNMSEYYKLIVTSVRVEPEYFQVTYYGNGFPMFFRNKSFIYRGKGYERLIDFTKRLQSQFPLAKLLDKLEVPDESTLKQSSSQFLLIFRVDPVMSDDVKNKFNSTIVDEKIMKYYQINQINSFVFSRPIFKDKSESNEIASMWIERTQFATVFPLPGILCRAEVCVKKTFELNPLENAIDTMSKVNDKTRRMITQYSCDASNTLPLHILIMHINGIVNSDVQGGITKYEDAFFQSNTTSSTYPKDDLNKLESLLADSIPLLDLAIQIIDQKQQNDSQTNMDGLYRYIVDSFEKMKKEVEAKHGKGRLPGELKWKEAYLRSNSKRARGNSLTTNNLKTNEARNSMENAQTLNKPRSIFARANGSTANLSNTLRFRKKDARRMTTDTASTMYASSTTLEPAQWYATTPKSSSHLSSLSDSKSDSFDVYEPQTNNKPRPSSDRSSIQSHMSLYRSNNSFSTLNRTNGNIFECANDGKDSEEPPPLPAKLGANL